ncbi:hypothetical protein B0H65DRAFT_257835 [Neurospora tetraspora]|uniref:Transmembrane protein n=1 Tax=Neurospora tetraspora TaxID=94610 RepID=A0AAE0MPD0_9PEZI|nr:hypothetical protein B0H65DRAFT_257835 [Neurospora tetraspora]
MYGGRWYTDRAFHFPSPLTLLSSNYGICKDDTSSSVVPPRRRKTTNAILCFSLALLFVLSFSSFSPARHPTTPHDRGTGIGQFFFFDHNIEARREAMREPHGLLFLTGCCVRASVNIVSDFFLNMDGEGRRRKAGKQKKRAIKRKRRLRRLFGYTLGLLPYTTALFVGLEDLGGGRRSDGR